MEKTDVNALATRMIEAVRSHVAAALAPLLARLDEFDARLKAIPAGPRGERGEPGESIKGEKGDAGESIVGPKGEPGESIRGDKGERGEPGAEPDIEPLRRALNAEVAHRFEALVREIPAPAPGKDGRDGIDGKDGTDGEHGRDGESVNRDTVALLVREAVDAAIDAMPRTLPADGKDGRDAAELDILPSIDEAKSYRRGTWASHNGGLIRAARQTDAVVEGALLEAGWVVMVEGLAAVVVTQGDDPREFEVAAMLTSGVKAVTPIRIPAVLDKGVWREGPHEQGDHVSWDGSGWIAQRATTDKPGTSDAWRLSTKRGRDGKDGGGEGGAAPAAVVRIK